MELTNIGRNIQTSFQQHNRSIRSSHSDSIREEDEVELQWAAIEKLPTFKRLRTSLLDSNHDNGSRTELGEKRMVDVTKLGPLERHLFIDKLIKHIENDNLQLLQRMRERIDRVGVNLPTVEVRYKNLSVEAKCEVVQGKPLPTLWNSLLSMITVFTKVFRLTHQEAKIKILNDVSGIIKPSRLTLLLGPPGCGKTTLLLALAGKLNQSLKVTGEVSYNGYRLHEFVPQKTSAYVSQYDLHIPEMTVRETVDFSGRCQGVSSRAEIMIEVSRREKEAGIVPDPDIDTYMKAISVQGQKRNMQTNYVLKILGLDICADIMVGDAMRRGISGGQKRRLTTGEMIVGPIKTLFMDEISTGLDSSTTFQIVACLQHMVHIMDSTALVALLQPSPETFELFDDLILMAEGKILYHGPRSHALQFFQDCGFKCPERKGAADFLQEVISKKDQAQYWSRTDIPYSYISVDQFCEMFKKSHLGEKLDAELSRPYNKSQCPKNALSFSTYSLSKWELFKACMAREFLLMKRNSFVYVFKTAQLVIIAFMTMTIFIRTRMPVDLLHANYFMGSLFYTLIRLMTNGVAELSLTVSRLPVFYKQQAFCLYPAWAYSIPASILKTPFSLLESILWTSITYYVIGYSPEVQRFFCQFILLFALHQASTSMCRFIASIFQTMVAATTIGSMALVLIFLFGGFILPRPSLPPWLSWAFWASPMTYGEIGVSLNEFLAPRWQKVSVGNTTLGQSVLIRHGLNFDGYFYWISVGALVGFAIFFDLGFVLALTYRNPPGMSRAIISKEKLSQLQKRDRKSSAHLDNDSTLAASPITSAEKHRTDNLVLPFEPLTMSFKDVKYFVDTPPEMKENGFNQDKLQLLHDITGAFRPGILTALMGVSGAGKTTLMDVLSGRKTGGTIEGDIRIGGYPKVQKTFARVSGYCEQHDIHSPQITVGESVAYSAWLRLPPEIVPETKAKFVEEVLEIIELDNIRDSLVGIPGVSGLSTEQRKRLTIAVELVSNPSIIFMDEPTSGLDARSAAIVMRTVKNVVATGRTTVCTIHQPSIDIFEAFDELILMKRGGQIIYSGALGNHSSKLIEYFEGITGLPKIKDNYNPATWMLEVTSASVEAELGLDFASIYKESPLHQETVELVRQLSEPPPGSKELHFRTRFPQNSREQYMACLWKQHLSYWRSPEYNLVRLVFMIVAAITFGALFWQKAEKINTEQDLFNILGCMYIAVIFLGINNCSTVLPHVATERNVLYREKFAGMYSSKAYSFAQVTIEIPYILLQAILFVAITYPSIGFYWSAHKVFWYFYATFCTFLYFVYLGMLIVSLSGDPQVASILATAVYTILSLFSGFLLPGPKIPKWWVWLYWICPTSWSLNGLLTSQYGDENKKILIFGEIKSISSFLQEYYGFRHDHLALVAVVLIAFPAIFAFLFAYCIGKLNFQRR
ncbi:pleiotropic drug resistance protein 3-like [Cornus florida]|uniref:pleiotropic drug resistance protein 3-like n=1 Tax=Cornus florida TaxID=4283 RepID=UPI00289C51FA|nr:pleiotropic drug resistance protein 3-like [Cornus florida]